MHVSKVSYLRRYNLGDYQHEEFNIEIQLEESEGFKEAHEALTKARKLFTVNSTKYMAAKRDAENAKEGAA